MNESAVSEVSRTMSSDESATQSIIRDLLFTFRDHLWEILGFTAVATIAAIVFISSLPNQYQSTATVLLEVSQQKVSTVNDIYDPGFRNREYILTQLALIKSRDIALRVVKNEGLADHPMFIDIGQPTRGRFSAAKLFPWIDEQPLERVTYSQEQKNEMIADAVRGSVSASLLPGTQMMLVTVSSSDNQLAALLANGFANAYIESGLDARLELVRSASEWLTERLDGMRENLESAELRLQEYRDREKLLDLGGVLGVVQTELSTNTQKMLEARKRRVELENAYRRVVSADNYTESLRSIPVIAADSAVIRNGEKLADARQHVKSLKDRYGPKHPKMIAAVARQTEVEQELASSIRVAALRTRSQYELARDNERSANTLVQKGREEVRSINKGEYKLGILQRDVESNKQLYDVFLTRFKQTDAGARLDTANARIVDEARPAGAPHSPNRKRLAIVAFVLAFSISFALARIQRALSDGVTTPDDLERLLNLPVLSSLPLLPRLMRDIKHVSQMSAGDAKSPFAESVRTLRTGVLLGGIDRRFKCLIVTSSLPGEGKTTISINLACALGQMKRVLLVETDLRRPAIANGLGLDDNSGGLSEVILEQCSLQEVIQHFDAGNIDVITSGQIPPNPLELLSSHRFKNILATLCDRYEHIVFDSAPCQPVSDAYSLGSQMDGVVFVARADATRRAMIVDSVKKLRQANSQVVGTVLNQYSVRRNPAARGYSYYYDSY